MLARFRADHQGVAAVFCAQVQLCAWTYKKRASLVNSDRMAVTKDGCRARAVERGAPPSMSLVRRMVYSPLVAALAVLTALLNSWLLLTSIVVCSAAKAVWGATMAQIANAAKRSRVLIRFFVIFFPFSSKPQQGSFDSQQLI